MEFLESESFKRLTNPGVESLQLLSPHNPRSTRVTVTSVTLAPRAEQPRHKNASSEQMWVAIAGEGTLLLEVQSTRPFKQGEVVRFEDGEIHGFKNTGTVPFVYISVTSPPINFSYAYKSEA